MARSAAGKNLPTAPPEEVVADRERPPREWLSQKFVELEQPLVRYVQRCCGARDRSFAQDVVQESFVKLCEQLWPDIREHATAWLYKACRNRAIDIQRREGTMKVVHGEPSDLAAVRDPQASAPDAALEQSDEIQAMRDKVVGLPERQQELLRLRLQEGLSYKQIAEVTGLSASNVGYLLHQAISSLRASSHA